MSGVIFEENRQSLGEMRREGEWHPRSTEWELVTKVLGVRDSILRQAASKPRIRRWEGGVSAAET